MTFQDGPNNLKVSTFFFLLSHIPEYFNTQQQLTKDMIATVLTTMSEYCIWLERDVLGLPPKLRYFPEDRDGGLFTETPFLILIAICSLVVLPLAEAIDGFP